METRVYTLFANEYPQFDCNEPHIKLLLDHFINHLSDQPIPESDIELTELLNNYILIALPLINSIKTAAVSLNPQSHVLTVTSFDKKYVLSLKPKA